MDRREWLGLVGVGGVGMCAGTASAAGSKERSDDKFLTPVKSMRAHFCGIHVAKNNPKFQIVAQHFCAPHNDQMFQCLLYDSCGKGAKLLGVEYIVSDKVFHDLPDSEKKYWHPHTYEVLAGGLIAPGMEKEEEDTFMKTIIQTWGKTWHTWPDPKTPVPMGEPLLMWSLMADDQVDKDVVAARDKEFGVSVTKIREERVKEFGMEVPNVPFPKSMDTIGRKWTAEGEDKPTKR